MTAREGWLNQSPNFQIKYLSEAIWEARSYGSGPPLFVALSGFRFL